MNRILREFRDFAVRGNVIDLAVGIIVGGAFGTIARSLVDDILMPPLGLLLGGVKFDDFFLLLKEGTTPAPYATVAEANAAGAVTINYGLFINNVVTFLIVSFAVFFLVRLINRLRREKEQEPPGPTTKNCVYCCSNIPLRATRCPACTSELPDADATPH